MGIVVVVVAKKEREGANKLRTKVLKKQNTHYNMRMFAAQQNTGKHQEAKRRKSTAKLESEQRPKGTSAPSSY